MSLTAVPSPSAPAAAKDEDDLEMLRINIRHWRKEKGLPFRVMPAAFWAEAIALARRLNVRRVASVLGLNVEELKRRMEGRQSHGAHTTVVAQLPPRLAAPPALDGPEVIDTPGAITPTFRVCDLPAIALQRPDAPTSGAQPSVAQPSKAAASPEPAVRPAPDASCAASAAEQAVLELTAADGSQLTLRMPVGSFNDFNVLRLVHGFRSPA